MATFTVKMRLDRETKGAARYQEIDEHGKDETVFHKLGTQYIRKTAFPKGSLPQEVTVTVEHA